MTIIKILRDDTGVLSLIRQNTATIDIEGDVEEAQPYPNIHPMPPKLPEKPRRNRRRYSAQSTRQQRGHDRRQQQRRQQDLPVILDTRTRFERRTQLRRNHDQRPVSQNGKPRIGFDHYA